MSSPDVVITRGKKYNNNNKRKNFSSLQDSCIYMYSVKTVTSFFSDIFVQRQNFCRFTDIRDANCLRGGKKPHELRKKTSERDKRQEIFSRESKTEQKKKHETGLIFFGSFLCVCVQLFGCIFIVRKTGLLRTTRTAYNIYLYMNVLQSPHVKYYRGTQGDSYRYTCFILLKNRFSTRTNQYIIYIHNSVVLRRLMRGATFWLTLQI